NPTGNVAKNCTDVGSDARMPSSASAPVTSALRTVVKLVWRTTLEVDPIVMGLPRFARSAAIVTVMGSEIHAFHWLAALLNAARAAAFPLSPGPALITMLNDPSEESCWTTCSWPAGIERGMGRGDCAVAHSVSAKAIGGARQTDVKTANDIP